MKIAFCYIGAEVLGIEFMSATLKRHGHDVRLFFDPSLFDDRAIFSMPALHRMVDLRPKMVESLIGWQPDIVAFSVLTNTYQWALETAELIRMELDRPIIFGGVHATLVPERVIGRPVVDMVNVGEGFEAFPELIGRLDQGLDITDVANLWLKRDGSVIRNPVRSRFEDLDTLPFPDKGLFADYFDVGELYLTMTGFGCPYRCTFCSNDVLREIYRGRGRHVRRRSVDHVIAELKHARQQYRIRVIKFADDIFTLQRGWLEDFADVYRREIGLPYITLAHPGHLDDQLAHLLRESGCCKLEIGVQSVNEQTKTEVLDRRESRHDLETTFAACESHGIPYMLNHMMGLPGEGEAEQLEAARLYSRYRPSRIGAYYLKYLPRTRINDIALDRGLINKEDVDAFADGYFATVHSNERLDPALRRMFKSFETLNVLMPLLPRGLNRWLVESRLRRRLYLVPSLLRTALDFLGGLVHRDWEPILFAKYYVTSVFKAVMIKLGLRGYRKGGP